jgi:hypothetical protein
VVHLSFAAIEEFHHKFQSKRVTDKLVRFLGIGWGVLAEKRRLNPEALKRFFSEGESAGELPTTTEK